MSEIQIPTAELTDVALLKTDGENPNRTTEKQREAIAESMRRYGMIIPIITNNEYLIADGEQRLEVATKTLGMKKVPVIRLPVSDVDRRLLRQILNKLRGEHVLELDDAEFNKIIGQGRENDLKLFLDTDEKRLEKLINGDQAPEPAESKSFEPAVPEPKLCECPRCTHVFNPDTHRVSRIKLELDTTGHLEGIQGIADQGLGKENWIEVNLTLKTTQKEISDRVIAVSEAFGIGVDETKTFGLFDTLRIGYNSGDIMYVTGDSGSGKTTLLGMFKTHFEDQGHKVVSFDAVKPDPEEIVIEGVGKDEDHAMRLLTAAGLSEAFLMLRKYGELSAGQQYRYRLAKMLGSDAEVFLVDEFGATLDRVMAKVVGYTFQKMIRRLDKTAIIASTHHDIIEDINPDILMFKGFASEAQIRYRDAGPREFSLNKEITLEPGNKDDLHSLDRFHYLAKSVGVSTAIYRLTYRGDAVAVIQYVSPHLALKARNINLPEYKKRANKEHGKKINAEIVRIARVIVHPKFRGAGLAVRLVKETMPMTGKRVVETLAAMAKYNPFFEKAGMTNGGVNPFNKEIIKLHAALREFGIEPAHLNSPARAQRFVDSLSEPRRRVLEKLIIRDLKSIMGAGLPGQRIVVDAFAQYMESGLGAALSSLVGTERVYLFWVNELLELSSSK